MILILFQLLADGWMRCLLFKEETWFSFTSTECVEGRESILMTSTLTMDVVKSAKPVHLILQKDIKLNLNEKKYRKRQASTIVK